jgi:N-acetylmuramoyl-L-alanine amidase
MINLVIAYSQQLQNKCKMGDTEQDHMFTIARILYNILCQDKRLNVYCIPKLNLGSDTANLRESVRLSNAFIGKNKGYHLELHSDAGAYAKGASGLYYSEAGKQFITPIMQELTDLTPWPDIGLRQRRDLLALKGTSATAGLIEVSFHDNPEEAKFIHDNAVVIAVRIASGLYKFWKGGNLIC